MNREIEVSIVCNTFNQKKYIKEALDSFLMQKTTFDYEILVHDDASTDGTQDIIKEYEDKYPDIIRPLYQKDNQWSKNINISYTFQYPRARGKFFAFCEGDDYWTSDNKLQKQYEIMMAHEELDMCAHKAVIVCDTKDELGNIGPDFESRILTTDEVIKGGGGYMPTNSLFYRKEIVEEMDPFISTFDIDYSLQIRGSLRGGIYYDGECMSAYRRNAEGSWTTKMSQDYDAKVSFYKKVIRMLKQLNIDTKGKYNRSINRALAENRFKASVFRSIALIKKLKK